MVKAIINARIPTKIAHPFAISSDDPALTKNKIAMVISKTIARIKATQIIIPKQY
jgi:hypothetical protein